MTVETVTGGLATYGDAKLALGEKQVGDVPHRNISFVVNNKDSRQVLAGDARPSKTVRYIEAGATFGGVVGGVAGFLVGSGSVAIPGMGPTLAVRWLGAMAASFMTGPIVGLAAGGSIGSLTCSAGSDERDNA